MEFFFNSRLSKEFIPTPKRESNEVSLRESDMFTRTDMFPWLFAFYNVCMLKTKGIFCYLQQKQALFSDMITPHIGHN